MRWTDLPVLCAALTACPAMAAPVTTRLVTCHPQSCLLVSGHRDDPASAVLVNGHAVPVEGGRHWHLRLPVATVRAWSPPLGRQIAVTVLDAQSGTPTPRLADLPIGLLGHADLAVLVASAR